MYMMSIQAEDNGLSLSSVGFYFMYHYNMYEEFGTPYRKKINH